MSSTKFGRNYLKGISNYRVATKVNTLAIRSYLQSLDCPRALAIWLMFESNEHEQLASIGFDPLAYLTIADVRDAYAATKFLAKYKDLTLDYDLDDVALRKFLEFEALCKQTNARFRNLAADPLYKGTAVWLHHAVTQKIDKILGELTVEDVFSLPDWGPGASTTVKRRDAGSAVKFQIETGITRRLHSLLPTELLRKIYPQWTQHLVESGFPFYQVGNKVVTVPKDAQTNRVIAIEPGINMWVQKALGKMIGRQLRRVGVDLTKQEINQEHARLGSITGLTATVDLSSASDSISYEVVRELLPSRWFHVLDACRSHCGSLSRDEKDGSKTYKPFRWEKFSSMGNGFTFQLESLIFYAIALCCAEYMHEDSNNVSVYGDDVIIPTKSFKLFSEMLAFYGFRVNMTKSHYASSFRESCGAHFISGVDIKPIYFKSRLSNLQSVFRLANAVRFYSHRRNASYGCDIAFRGTFDHLVSAVPSALRLRIPLGFGDGGFISNFDEATPTRPTKWANGQKSSWIEGYTVRHLVEPAESRLEERFGYELAELWRLSKRDGRIIAYLECPPIPKAIARAVLKEPAADLEGEGRNSVPTFKKQLRVSNGIVRQWYDLGPWV